MGNVDHQHSSRPSRRAIRALQRQLEYQRAKAAVLRGRETAVLERILKKSSMVRAKLEAFRPIPASCRVLEVGSGAHGLIFGFNVDTAIGIDPLADHYRALFPAWQSRFPTVAGRGEALPFANDTFGLVLCDNVVDHAESPRRIVEEMIRVLAPGGMLYFTVNTHHPLYHLASVAHGAWTAMGLPLEIGPFADHTVHLTPTAARTLLADLPLTVLRETDDGRQRARGRVPVRHPGDWLKVLFFKNAQYEAIAVKDG